MARMLQARLREPRRQQEVEVEPEARRRPQAFHLLRFRGVWLCLLAEEPEGEGTSDTSRAENQLGQRDEDRPQ